MTPQSLLDLVISTLRADLRCESIGDREMRLFSEEQFLIKVRAQIQDNLFFQVLWLHHYGATLLQTCL